MSFWYNEPKDGSKFAQLNCNDWETLKSTACIFFDELIVRKIDDVFYCYAYASAALDVEKSGIPGFQLKDQFCTWVIRKKPFERKKKEGDKWVSETIEPSVTEKLWWEILEEYALHDIKEGFGWKGHFKFTITQGQADAICDRPNEEWDYSPKQIAKIKAEYMHLEGVELVKLKGVELPVPQAKKQYSGGGSKAQTEAERLKDKWEFCKLHFPLLTADCQTLEEVCRKLVLMNPTERNYADLSLDTMIDFMQ